MTAANHTKHYELSQYTENDHPTYTGDYNGDMSKIDAAIYAASQSGGIANVAHDNTLTGDGTGETPLGVAAGTAINPIDKRWNDIDFNDFYVNGIYTFNGASTNSPREEWSSGMIMVLKSYQAITQIYYSAQLGALAIRHAHVPDEDTAPTAGDWAEWEVIASVNDIPDVSALTRRIAVLETTVGRLTSSVTPSTTGLTAEALDAQYSDDYNIIRTGHHPTGRSKQ